MWIFLIVLLYSAVIGGKIILLLCSHGRVLVLSGQYLSNNFLAYKTNGIVSTTLYPKVIKIFFCPKSELGEERRRSGVSVVSGPTSNIDTAQTRVCRAPVTIQYCHIESSGRVVTIIIHYKP